MPPRTCVHSQRRLDFPGGYATLALSGSWSAYFAARPGEVFRIESCPECLTALWGIPADPNPYVAPPAVVHSSRRRADS